MFILKKCREAENSRITEVLCFKEGNNVINKDGQSIVVGKFITLNTGICYRITPNFFNYFYGTFALVFNKKVLKKDDIPDVKIYLTSEENSQGQGFLTWWVCQNGRLKKFKLLLFHQNFRK